MRSTHKQFTQVVEYNGELDSDDNDEDVEFINVDLPCNKLSIQLLVNDSITRTKRRQTIETDNENDKRLNPKATWEKRKPVKQVGKKSTKASVPISSLVGQPAPDIQALLINTNIVITVLHFFQILPKFREETRRLMTVPRKPREKKILSLAFPFIEEEEEHYAKIHHNNNGLRAKFSLPVTIFDNFNAVLIKYLDLFLYLIKNYNQICTSLFYKYHIYNKEYYGLKNELDQS